MVRNVRNWITSSFIPSYAVKPLTMMFLANVICYYATLPYTQSRFHYDLSTSIDYRIPFLPIFIIPYILAYFQWVIGYICIAKESEKRCKEICYCEIISKFIAGFIFVVMPTAMTRPNIENSGVFNGLVALIYASDPATNLFPSIHCMESWICLRGTYSSDSYPKWYRILMLIMTVLVFASTVFVKQHVIVDIAGGIAVAEIGRLISQSLTNKQRTKET